jgi:hypothetical protein
VVKIESTPSYKLVVKLVSTESSEVFITSPVLEFGPQSSKNPSRLYTGSVSVKVAVYPRVTSAIFPER